MAPLGEDIRRAVATQEVRDGGLVYPHGGGGTYWHYVVSPIGGQKARALVLLLDITNTVKDLDRISARERRLIRLLEHLPILVWTTDSHLRVTFIGGTGVMGLGLRPSQLLHRTLFEILQIEDQEHEVIVAHRRALEGQTGSFTRWWRGRLFACWVEPVPDAEGQVIEVVGVALDITDWAQAVAEQRQLRHQVEQLARELLRAQEEQRRWVAMDIHDALLPLIAGALMQLQGHLARRHPARTPATLQRARELLQLAMQEGRRIIRGLEPPLLEEQGLAAALQAWLEGLAAGTPCQLEWSVEPEVAALRLEPLTERFLLRIAQEAVGNAIQHSRSPKVAVSLRCEGDKLVLTVQDHGRGLRARAHEGEGLGLRGMAERAALIGAQLAIHSQPGQGTQVRVELPRPHRR